MSIESTGFKWKSNGNCFFQTVDGGYVYFYVSIENVIFLSVSIEISTLFLLQYVLEGSETRVSGPIPALRSPIRKYVIFMKPSVLTSPIRSLWNRVYWRPR